MQSIESPTGPNEDFEKPATESEERVRQIEQELTREIQRNLAQMRPVSNSRSVPGVSSQQFDTSQAVAYNDVHFFMSRDKQQITAVRLMQNGTYAPIPSNTISQTLLISAIVKFRMMEAATAAPQAAPGAGPGSGPARPPEQAPNGANLSRVQLEGEPPMLMTADGNTLYSYENNQLLQFRKGPDGNFGLVNGFNPRALPEADRRAIVAMGRRELNWSVTDAALGVGSAPAAGPVLPTPTSGPGSGPVRPPEAPIGNTLTRVELTGEPPMLMTADGNTLYSYENNQLLQFRKGPDGNFALVNGFNPRALPEAQKRAIVLAGRELNWSLTDAMLGVGSAPAAAPVLPTTTGGPGSAPPVRPTTSEPVRPTAPTVPEEAPQNPETAGTMNINELFTAVSRIRFSFDLPNRGANFPITLNHRISDAPQLASHLRQNNIPVARYPQYLANMREQSAKLVDAIKTRAGWERFNGPIDFDGHCMSAKMTGGETLFATATQVLVMGAGTTLHDMRAGRANVRTLDNRNATITHNASSIELRIGGRREIHRLDGGLQMTQEGENMAYHDGDNRRPVMERNSGAVSIIGANGERVPIPERGSIRTQAQAETYGRELAMRLRTPEAIAAYVSHFWANQDQRQGPELSQYFNEVRGGNAPLGYIPDEGGVQDVQSWQRSIMRGQGDCEDYALLAEGLLKLAGIPAFTMLVSSVHYEAVYFERAGRDEAGREQYHACTVGLNGFNRSATKFTSLGAAAASVWQGSGSGAELQMGNREVREAFGESGRGRGVFIQNQPTNVNDTSGPVDIKPYSDEAYFRQFVRG